MFKSFLGGKPVDGFNLFIKYKYPFFRLKKYNLLFKVTSLLSYANSEEYLRPYQTSMIPIDAGRKLNVHKTLRRRPARLLNVLCTFGLRSMYMGMQLSCKNRKDSSRLTIFVKILYYKCFREFYILWSLNIK